jgi:flagellar biosynthesis protein FlhG
MRRVRISLRDFFEKKIPLQRLILQTEVPKLAMIPGNLDAYTSENIKYTQKLKFFRHLKSIPADYIVVDLGGGSNLNIMDTFLLADRMIVVGVPEVTAIENLYHFIKNVFLRKLHSLLGIYGLRDIAYERWKNRQARGIRNFQDLITSLDNDSSPGSSLQEDLYGFKVYLILNQIRNTQQISLGFSIKSICSKNIGVNTYYIGYVEYDVFFWKNFNSRYAQGQFNLPPRRLVHEIDNLTNNLMEDKQLKVTVI